MLLLPLVSVAGSKRPVDWGLPLHRSLRRHTECSKSNKCTEYGIRKSICALCKSGSFNQSWDNRHQCSLHILPPASVQHTCRRGGGRPLAVEDVKGHARGPQALDEQHAHRAGRGEHAAALELRACLQLLVLQRQAKRRLEKLQRRRECVQKG